MRGRNLVREFTLALFRARTVYERVDQLARTLLDDRGDARDRPGREPRCRDFAVVAVLGRIHANDAPHPTDSLVGLDDRSLVRTLEHDAKAVEKAVRLFRDFADLAVTHDRVEGIEAIGLAVLQPVSLSERAPLGVGRATLGVGLRSNQVEPVDLGHHRLPLKRVCHNLVS